MTAARDTPGSRASGSPQRPILFGELLWDQFPSGQAVLGGAPFNVAWHLQGFGLAPLLISRVGQDDHGDRVRSSLQAWGLDLRGIQIDSTYPTGAVQVRLGAAGEPSFEILANQAYDFIDPDQALATIQTIPAALLYHGTLATRIPSARAAIQTIQSITGLPIFLDVNLRDPWWNWNWIGQVLQQARWVKLNRTELDQILANEQIQCSTLADQATALREHYDLELLIVTLGSEGALLALPDQILQESAAPVDPLIDTVGAGDAFAAVVILGLQNTWSANQILKRAIQFASATCQIPGSVTLDPDFYKRYLQQWEI